MNEIFEIANREILDKITELGFDNTKDWLVGGNYNEQIIYHNNDYIEEDGRPVFVLNYKDAYKYSIDDALKLSEDFGCNVINYNYLEYLINKEDDELDDK